jgi:ribonuclease HIII
VAARSITVALPAESVIGMLQAYAEGQGGALERLPLQNGARIRMALPAGPAALNVYPSKGGVTKVVFDRPDTPEADAIAALLGGTASVLSSKKAPSTVIEPVLAGAACWIGSDESGKGDYFGPLVTAAVALTSATWRVIEALGVRDSKALTDAAASALASQIREAFPHEVVTIMPPRYNELWRTMGNVNRVLAWAHARAIEEVAGRAPDATAAVADQFGDEYLIREALFRRGRRLQLVQMPRAERDPAVAAASILARAEFLRRLDQLGRKAGLPLPKGAGPQVDAAARTLVAAHGREALAEYAKLHFKNTKRL